MAASPLIPEGPGSRDSLPATRRYQPSGKYLFFENTYEILQVVANSMIELEYFACNYR